jgi:FkbH-like protein
MSGQPLRVVLVSDGQVGNLAAALVADGSYPALAPEPAPFGPVLATLLDPNASIWAEQADVSVVWTRPEGVLPAFRDAVAGLRADGSTLDAEVDAFVNAVEMAAGRTKWTLVPTWTPPFGGRGIGVVDLHDPSGLRALLARANHRLLDRLRELRGTWVLDASPWMEAAGPARDDRRMWYAAKVPFPAPVFRAAARDIRAFLRAATGLSRKLIILDLDNTLWGGIVGETGWEGLKLGGHDAVGEAFVDFQRALKALAERGVVLGIVSKNEEETALDAIRKHPEMILRERDFAGWRINWEDKAANVASLLEELRLGADAAVFIDDQPAERARVAEALPDVLVPEWPVDPLAAASALDRLACFDVLQLSEEDRRRTESYSAERERRKLRERVSSNDDWLKTLNVQVRVKPVDRADLSRAAQLLNKTNQMNLATRRMSEEELRTWVGHPDRTFLVLRVSDRFGDLGLTGLISMERTGSILRVVDFVLSCRAMSRQVEEAMVHMIVQHGRELQVSQVRAEFLPTARNAPMLAFWQERSRFSVEGDFTFFWDVRKPYPATFQVQVTYESRSESSDTPD